jgi:hypothetical protein
MKKTRSKKSCDTALVRTDHVDPFFIEKGRPAEREIGERETSGGVVHVVGATQKLRTRIAC